MLKDCEVNIGNVRQYLNYFTPYKLPTLSYTKIASVELMSLWHLKKILHRSVIHVQSAEVNKVTGANVLVYVFLEWQQKHPIF